jgi:nitroreductase
MNTIEAIFTRHSISAVMPDPIPHELTVQLLSAAVQAPNHFHVRPWHFVVIEGAARERLGNLFAQILLTDHPELPPAALEKERAKPLRAPLLIAVGVTPPDDTRQDPIEDICAVAAACENLLLAAHELGLGVMWRTGSMVHNPLVKAFLGLSTDRPLIGFLYIGFPANLTAVTTERPSYEDRVTWMA